MATPILTLTPNVSGGVTQSLNDRNPFTIDREGFTIPTPVYDEEFAESSDTEGGRRVRSRPQNPTGTIPLQLRGTSDANMLSGLSNLQQTVGMVNRHGGELTYTPSGGTATTYDIESIRISDLPQDEFLFNRARPVLEFTCRPFGRLTPVALVTNATSSDPIQSVSLPDIPGSADAWISATITDTATQARDHLEIGLDDDWDGSAALIVDSANLSVSGLGGSATTRTGAYSTNGVIRSTLTTTAVAVCEKTGLTHRGTHRIKARVFASGTGPYYCRLAWRIGSGPWSRNAWASPLDDVFSEIDLGLVRVPKGSIGTLTIRVEAKSATAADTLDIDYLLVIPTAKWAKAFVPTSLAPASTFSVRDEFNQTAGALTGKSLALGSGSWTAVTNSDTDDFTVDATNHVVTRSVSADTGTISGYFGGRMVTAGTTSLSELVAKVDIQSNFSSTAEASLKVGSGLVLRWVDASNYLLAQWENWTAGSNRVAIYKVIAGTRTQLGAVNVPTALSRTLQVSVGANGRWVLYDTGGSVLTSGYDAVLVTGGTLASGRIGLAQFTLTGAITTFDNLAAWVPDVQHVTASGGGVVLNHNSIQRTDGTRPPEFEGRYLTCPPAGREDRVPRLAVKLRRNNVDGGLPDDQIADAQRVDVEVVPRVILL